MIPQLILALKAAFAAIVLVFTLTGCGSLGGVKPETDAQAVAQVDVRFTAAVEELVSLREQGRLGDSLVRRADTFIQRGDQALDLAWAAVRADDSASVKANVATLRAVLVELLAITEEVE